MGGDRAQDGEALFGSGVSGGPLGYPLGQGDTEVGRQCCGLFGGPAGERGNVVGAVGPEVLDDCLGVARFDEVDAVVVTVFRADGVGEFDDARALLSAGGGRSVVECLAQCGLGLVDGLGGSSVEYGCGEQVVAVGAVGVLGVPGAQDFAPVAAGLDDGFGELFEGLGFVGGVVEADCGGDDTSQPGRFGRCGSVEVLGDWLMVTPFVQVAQGRLMSLQVCAEHFESGGWGKEVGQFCGFVGNGIPGIGLGDNDDVGAHCAQVFGRFAEVEPEPPA